jgi:hypothetical protein
LCQKVEHSHTFTLHAKPLWPYPLRINIGQEVASVQRHCLRCHVTLARRVATLARVIHTFEESAKEQHIAFVHVRGLPHDGPPVRDKRVSIGAQDMSNLMQESAQVRQ